MESMAKSTVFLNNVLQMGCPTRLKPRIAVGFLVILLGIGRVELGHVATDPVTIRVIRSVLDLHAKEAVNIVFL